MARPRKLKPVQKKAAFHPADLFEIERGFYSSDAELVHLFGSIERAREAWFFFRDKIIAHDVLLAKLNGHPLEFQLPWTFWRFERPELEGVAREVDGILEALHRAKSELRTAEAWADVEGSADYWRSMGHPEKAEAVLREGPERTAAVERAKAHIAKLQAKLDVAGAKLVGACPQMASVLLGLSSPATTQSFSANLKRSP
jgi:hypothetical protein